MDEPELSDIWRASEPVAKLSTMVTSHSFMGVTTDGGKYHRAWKEMLAGLSHDCTLQRARTALGKRPSTNSARAALIPASR